MQETETPWSGHLLQTTICASSKSGAPTLMMPRFGMIKGGG